MNAERHGLTRAMIIFVRWRAFWQYIRIDLRDWWQRTFWPVERYAERYAARKREKDRLGTPYSFYMAADGSAHVPDERHPANAARLFKEGDDDSIYESCARLNAIEALLSPIESATIDEFRESALDAAETAKTKDERTVARAMLKLAKVLLARAGGDGNKRVGDYLDD